MNRLSILLLFLLSFGMVKAGDSPDFKSWGPQHSEEWGFMARVGFTIGGTAPLPMPREIRKINSYKLDGFSMLGIDAYRLFNDRWGLLSGVRLSYEGMKTKADVKNYHITITQNSDRLTGNYTGTDENNVRTLSLKVPIEVLYRVSPRWALRGGPYLQINLSRKFDGTVYNGYLREGNPTGQKVDIDASNPATYDFHHDMRRVLYGFEAGADWKASRLVSCFAQLDWGADGIFKSDFETIRFNMYPIYLTLGVAFNY
jgi:hypothetical protein